MQHAKQDLFNSVPDAAKNKRVQRGLQNALNELARLELTRGNITAAEVQAEASARQAQAIAESDPDNRFWLNEQCQALIRLATVQIVRNQKIVARETLARAQFDTTRLIGIDATRVETQVYLRGSILALAVRVNATPSQSLRTSLDEYLATTRQMIDRGTILRPTQLLARATAEFELGRLLSAMGQSRDALAHWQAVIDSLAAGKEVSDFDQLTLLARARFAIGEIDAARQLVQRIEASTYRHPDYAELVKEMNSGKGPVPSITKPRSTS